MWEAYSSAYAVRYGVEPLRNAKVNGALANLLKRIPTDEAPAVARFFVGSDDKFYVNAGPCDKTSPSHPLGHLMNIVSIHTAGTSGPQCVTFNVDGPINPIALSRMRLEGIWLGAQGDLLTVEAGEPITPAMIDRILDRYAEVEVQIAREADVEHAKRQAMLDSVMASTGLPLGTRATE